MIMLITMVTDAVMLANAEGNLASQVFELKEPPSHYAKPIVLTLKFDPAKIGPGKQAAVHYFDETNKVWNELGGEVNGSLITVRIEQMGKFAVLSVQNQMQASE
ncbi:hypothetical protein M3201_18050 [Paenibacillus motobuensis]|nr:hypothetical protein [Paenibacillus lutimineralis]MCM3648705.1 hypothetical protein [Paenibacillus motobuensis]